MSFDPIDFLERAVQTPSHEEVSQMRDLLVETLESASGESADRESANGESAGGESDDSPPAVEVDDAAGIEVDVDDAGNTIAVRDSGREGPHVVLNTHIDTVPPHVEFAREGDSADPDTIIRGRGSCDAKGPLAAMLAAFLGTAPERGRVTLAVTPDEETGSTGAAALDFDSKPDAVTVGEPTELDVCNAAKGRFQATVTVRGANAHAAEPQAGVNAVRAAGDLLAALDSFDQREDTPNPSDALGAPTLTPTTIEGGTATNQVPAECSFVVDRRSVPPETADGFRAALEEHLRDALADSSGMGRASEAGVEVALAERETPFLAAFETPADSEIVRALAEASAATSAEEGASGGAVRPFGAATEASYFAQVAPTVVFGPGSLADDEGAVAHAPREYVRVREVEQAGEALATTLAEFVQ